MAKLKKTTSIYTFLSQLFLEKGAPYFLLSRCGHEITAKWLISPSVVVSETSDDVQADVSASYLDGF